MMEGSRLALFMLCLVYNIKTDYQKGCYHTFRMALNSYVYVPMGLPASERAKLLGHSVETNLKYYTFARSEEYLDELTEKINAFGRATRQEKRGTSILFPFRQKKKAPRPLNLRLFLKDKNAEDGT